MEIVPRRNLELKCPLADFAAARQVLQSLAALSGGAELQIDTYFQVLNGRLKLRQIQDGVSVLIAYERPDQAHFRTSSYHLVPVLEPLPLKAALAATLGIRGEVRKRREIFLWHNVRIHLDQVDDLGTFLELEAVLTTTAGEVVSLARLHEVCRALAIEPAASLVPGYADLLGF